MHKFSDSYSFKVVNCQYTLNSKDITTMQDISSTLNYLEKMIWVFLTSEVWFFFSDEIGSAYTSEVTTLFTSYNGLFFIGAKYFVTILNFNSFHSITRRRHQLSIQINMQNISFTPWGVSYCIFFKHTIYIWVVYEDIEM